MVKYNISAPIIAKKKGHAILDRIRYENLMFQILLVRLGMMKTGRMLKLPVYCKNKKTYLLPNRLHRSLYVPINLNYVKAFCKKFALSLCEKHVYSLT